MATVALGIVGAGVGSIFGNWEMGWAAGTLLAGVLFPEKLRPQDRGKLDDLKVSGSGWGSMIPQVYGAMRLGGNVIWATDLVEHHHAVRSGGKGTSRATSQVYTYTCSFIMQVCRGPIPGIKRIWAEDELIYDTTAGPATKYDITPYTGSETQTMDARVGTALGASPSPNYRGSACVLFWDLDLSPWGNRIPAMTFEILPPGYDSTIIGDASTLCYYRFEDSPGMLKDSGPNGYHLTESGSGAAQITGPSGLGKGLNLTTNTSDKLDSVIGQKPRFLGNQFTAEWWVKFAATGISGDLIFAYTDSIDTNYSVQMTAHSNASGSTRTANAFVSPNGGLVQILSGTLPGDTNWHHVACTYKSGGQAKLYIDGSQVDFAGVTGPITSGTGLEDRIRFEDGPFYCDEAAMYDRELSASEIATRAAGAGGGTTVATILADQFAQVGLVSSQWDVSAATDAVTGFTIGSRTECAQAIEPVLRFYTTDLVEVDGKIKAVKRGGASVVTIPAADLGAHVAARLQPDQSPPPVIAVKRTPDLELPLAVDLSYFNSPTSTNNRFYEQASARAIRYTKGQTTQEALTINTPLVLAEDAARQGAERALYQQWTERSPFSLALGPKYLYLAPSDVVTVPVAGGTARIRLERVDVGLFGELRAEAVLDSADVLTQSIGGAVLPDNPAPTSEASATTLLAFSINALRDADADSIGFYAAANGPLASDWPGATLYWSRDGGATYQVLESLTDGATLGAATTVLADSGNWQTWDTTSTVDVTISAGDAPASASDAEVLNGANAALLGNEVIQFATVTSLGSNSYRLSRLLRGRRGTEASMAGHTNTDRFCLLVVEQVKRVNLDDSLAAATILLKAVTAGGTLAGTSSVSLLVTGNERKCYAPTQVTSSRDGGSNIAINWVRRTRKGGEWKPYVDVDQPEATLAYEIDVLASPGGALKRTLTASTETVTYTSANQVTDFGSNQSSVSVVIYEIGKFGRGYGRTATV